MVASDYDPALTPSTLPFALLSIIITGRSLNIFSALGVLLVGWREEEGMQ